MTRIRIAALAVAAAIAAAAAWLVHAVSVTFFAALPPGDALAAFVTDLFTVLAGTCTFAVTGAVLLAVARWLRSRRGSARSDA